VKFKLFFLLLFVSVLVTGCSKKQVVPSSIGPEESYTSENSPSSSSEGSSVSLPDDSNVVSEVSGGEVAGGVSSSGKYTGIDGKSASGIKMIYFSSDRYDIEPDQMKRLLSDIPKIKKLASIGKVRVEGNCDEFGTNEYNYALGLKRAKAVRSVLINQGIPASKISIVSYGESNPVCTGHTAPCHAKNRRVEINQI
jgi:peptidoglycan-associated lipoprotein